MCLSDKLRQCASLPSELLIGGDSFALPEYGDETKVYTTVVLRELDYPIRFSVSKSSGMRHYQRSFNECCGLSLSFPTAEYMMEGLKYGGLPEPPHALRVVEKLRMRFSLPMETSRGMVEKDTFMNASMGEFSFRFEPSCYGELKRCFLEMLGDLLADSPDENYLFKASLGFGAAACFEGETHNVSPVIRDLLPLVQDVNDYPAYNLTYYPCGPRNWRDREKSRKKLKSPGIEDLGTLTMENGVVATVSLRIEKEGYVFYLNFESDDDIINFYDTKLFQKTKWHSGAE